MEICLGTFPCMVGCGYTTNMKKSCLPLLETRLKKGLEIGQSSSIAAESVVPATALSVKLRWFRLQSMIRRSSPVLPIVGRLINFSSSNVPSPLLSYMNTQPVATVSSLTVHDTFSAHWPVETSWSWYP